MPECYVRTMLMMNKALVAFQKDPALSCAVKGLVSSMKSRQLPSMKGDKQILSELKRVIWLILAELICFFQRFSHACLR